MDGIGAVIQCTGTLFGVLADLVSNGFDFMGFLCELVIGEFYDCGQSSLSVEGGMTQMTLTPNRWDSTSPGRAGGRSGRAGGIFSRAGAGPGRARDRGKIRLFQLREPKIPPAPPSAAPPGRFAPRGGGFSAPGAEKVGFCPRSRARPGPAPAREKIPPPGPNAPPSGPGKSNPRDRSGNSEGTHLPLKIDLLEIHHHRGRGVNFFFPEFGLFWPFFDPNIAFGSNTVHTSP